MIRLKTAEEIQTLREGGRRLAFILQALAEMVRPGLSTDELNRRGEELAREGGDKPAFLGYKPSGAKRPYPASVCVSVNDEIVHGVPNEDLQILKEGDIVSIDMGLVHKGLITDAALTVPVGAVPAEVAALLRVTKSALSIGIGAARAGAHVGDIGAAIEEYVKPHNFGIIRELSGHGVGYEVHEDPYVPNWGKKGDGEVLRPGMVIAIEPMLTLGGSEISLAKDGYTYVTKDGSMSAHFEHTVAITEKGSVILTSE